MHWQHIFFHWPDGGVWSNIVASAIWVSPTVIAASLNFKRHREVLHRRLDDLHLRMRRHEKSLNELHAKHDAIHAHLGIDLGKGNDDS